MVVTLLQQYIYKVTQKSISLAECNTILSTYTLYRYLGQYYTYPSIYSLPNHLKLLTKQAFGKQFGNRGKCWNIFSNIQENTLDKTKSCSVGGNLVIHPYR